ncbi:MAG: hypothetical protein N4A49_03515 [Marinifilaceae bacterium]|jgi:hypothetical protein|nr:hypothetical protein [Marinifilaceae bacterium]
MKLFSKLFFVLFACTMFCSCVETTDVYEDKTEIKTLFSYVKDTDWSGTDYKKTAEIKVAEITADVMNNCSISVYNHPVVDGNEQSSWQPLSFTYPDFTPGKEYNNIFTKYDYEEGKIILTLMSPYNPLGDLVKEAEYKIIIIGEKEQTTEKK